MWLGLRDDIVRKEEAEGKVVMPDVLGREILEFGAFEFDLQSGELRKNGLAVKLGSREVHVLLALLEHPGQLVARSDLQQRLWPNDTFVEFDNGLNNAISRLRAVLADTAENPRYVLTVPRQGYRFAAPVNRRAAATPPTKQAFKFSRWQRVAVAAVLVIGIGVAGWRHWRHAESNIDSVAVLPFVPTNPTDPAGREYVSGALTEAVYTKLSGIHGLTLAPQTAATASDNSKAALAKIARDLHVDAVVRGSVQTGNNDLQVTVELVNADGATLWTESFEDQMLDFPLLTRSVARGIIRAASIELSGQEQANFALPPRISPQAFEAFQKGLYCLGQQTEDSRARARGYFQQAVAVAPNFAEAYAGLSNSYVNATSVPPRLAIPGAKSYAMRAIELNSVLPYPHTALAIYDFYGEWNWKASETEFRRALTLDPGFERAHQVYASLLSSESRVESAVEQIHEAHDLNPVATSVYYRAANVWINARQYNQAIEQGNQLVALNPSSVPGHEVLGTVYLFQQKYARAEHEFQDAAALSVDNAHVTALLGSTYARWGKTSLAAQQLAELQRLGRSGYVPSYWFATYYASAGADQDAADWLERAYQEHDPHMVDLKVSPWFDSLRSEPRFTELIKKMNFPE